MYEPHTLQNLKNKYNFFGIFLNYLISSFMYNNFFLSII